GARSPGRPVWLAMVLVVPLLVAGGALGYVSWIEWRIPQSVQVPDAVDQRAVEEILGKPWPRQVPLADACVAMLQSVAGTTFTSEAAHGDIDTAMAYAAAHARSSGDPTL